MKHLEFVQKRTPGSHIALQIALVALQCFVAVKLIF